MTKNAQFVQKYIPLNKAPTAQRSNRVLMAERQMFNSRIISKINECNDEQCLPARMLQ